MTSRITDKGLAAWVKVAVRVSSQAAPGVADALLSVARGLEQREDSLIAYLPDEGAAHAAVSAVKQRLAALRAAGLEVGRTRITVRPVRARRWEQAWKAGLELVRVSPCLVIKPTWKKYAPAPGEVVVELDPGMAFGTGSHATTRGCLAALSYAVRRGMTVCDIGAGSGVLAIAAAKLGARRVAAVEIDETAARVAAHNATRNRVADRVLVIIGDGLRCLRPGADIIVANLTAEQVVSLAAPAAAHLRPGGLFIASGIAAGQEPFVAAVAAQCGLTLRQSRTDEQWVTMIWELTGNAPPAG